MKYDSQFKLNESYIIEIRCMKFKYFLVVSEIYYSIEIELFSINVEIHYDYKFE